MMQWKQRLYAFLLRRVLRPFLDASSTTKLHDSIDFSLQEGKFVLTNISLNAAYLSERLGTSQSPLTIRKANVQRLEICFSLRENASTSAAAPAAQSSLAWRAMKLGGGSREGSSLPAVSLIAEIHLQGVELELVPCDCSLQQRPLPPAPESSQDETSTPTTKSMIGTYVDAALSSLLMTLKLSNIHLKMCHPKDNGETWMGVRMHSFTYRDLDQHQGETSSAYKMVLNKSLEFSDITIDAGEDGDVSRLAVVAMAQGSGRVFFRMMEYNPAATVSKPKNSIAKKRNLSQDIDVSLNHQLNFSLDHTSLGYIQEVADSLAQSSAVQDQQRPATAGSTNHILEAQDSMPRLKNPLFEDEEADHEDLKAITGIMKQYKEAYHLAENNQLRGGVLVPNHAYVEDSEAVDEDDAMAFDVFFDANDQSFYDAASVLKESVLMLDPGDEDGGSVQTKLRMNLLAGCIKLNFREETSLRPAGPQEYILVTMDDLNVSLSSTPRRSQLALSVAHFEIEDAQIGAAFSGGRPSGTIDIGSLLSFLPDSSDVAEYDNEVVVSQAPCITLQTQISKEQNNEKSVECNLALLPLEATVRQRSLANLARFAAQSGQRSKPTPCADYGDKSCGEKQISFSCTCPSLTVSLPIVKHVPTAPLFNRCGEILADAPVSKASLGLTLDTIDIQWSQRGPETLDNGLKSSAKFSFYHMLLFASAPVGDKVTVGAKMQRTDLMLLNGRTEVNPYIPVTLKLLERLPSSMDGALGRETFPIVPTISSFKARQEDEDEELKIDRLLFSKLEDVDTNSRDDLRGSDPQIAMVAESEKSGSVLRLDMPEIIVDLTKTELAIVIDMLEAAKPDMPILQKPAEPKDEDSKKASRAVNFAVAINVDQISCSLKQDYRADDRSGNKSGKDRFSCLFAVNNFRTHLLLNGSDLRHLRVFAHDVGLYSALHPRVDAEVRRNERVMAQRVGSMKQKIRVYKEAAVSPLLYRSQIFTPICQDAPSVLVDVRDTGSTSGLSQRQVNVTFYHLTFRYDVDSDCIEQLKGLLPDHAHRVVPSQGSGAKQAEVERPPSMTRLFVSIADCNLDYTSAPYFEMASRSIVRLGDFRFSSNVMVPASRNQAYSVSMGDLSYHLSNERLSYFEEDMRLCRASIIMPTRTSRNERSRNPSIHGTTAEALMREMDFVEVLGLNSMDGVIATTKWDELGRNRQPAKNPEVTTSLTFGMVSVTACKDSFHCFATTLGELQAKWTALTDDDIKNMRNDDAANRNEESKMDGRQPLPVFQKSEEESTLKQDSPDSFLLDGYEWMEIDHDPLRELEIPDGDEQVAGWYESAARSPTKLGPASNHSKSFPGRIIHHHFPLHSIPNPMGDGDMGASRYAGEAAVLSLKSRLLVHKLAVKIRFFDGFDWPNKVSETQKGFLKKKGNFVIEPIPRAEATRAKEALSRDVAGKLEEEYGENTAHIRRKCAIMADLLATDEKEDDKSPFTNTPLPEERAKTIEEQTELRRLSRKTKLYLQVSANGMSIRLDSYESSATHRLASVMSASISDMFIAESASLAYPVKMLGEWVNENQHPRDTRFGTLMLRMVTWKAKNLITEDNEVESDDCEVSLQLLPMRAIIDQRAIHFARAFFQNDEDEEVKQKWSSRLHLIPPPRFRAFRVRQWKLKVDYIPQKLDVSALREGSIVELINISPIDGMIILLNQVSVEEVVGLGDVMGGLTGTWLQEIVSTQLHKFLANARPFEPISDVSQGVSDLVVLPYEAFKNGDGIRRAMSSGIKSLAETVTFQALTTTSRLTEYAASKMATVVGGRYHNSASNPLPARPTAAPKGVCDVTGHAMESLARGFQAANHKIVIVPYRDYTLNGATGAATSVLRGIPVMLVAPMTGATEALSYTLLGARNALRPDIRREEEASRTGFTSYDV